KPTPSAVAGQNASDGGNSAIWVAISSPWGGQDLAHLGREHPEEGNPMAPMSFAIDARGRALILDEVNGRIVRYGADGRPETSFPMDRPTAQDIAAASDGSTAVLDRFGTQEVAIYDQNGALRGAVPLAGDSIEDTGEITGLFVDGKDVYVEREHGPL